LVGLAIGVAATVFGYDNRTSVDVNWTVFHFHGIPLWTVAVVPLTLVLIAGTLFHWMNGLHHFTEHMRHRRRVHELEAELATLRAHLDRALEMPAVASSKLAVRKESLAALPEANGGLDDLAAPEPEPQPVIAAADAPPVAATANKRSRKRVTLEVGDAQPDRNDSHLEGVVGDTPEQEA
jgi:hypothetical protein